MRHKEPAPLCYETILGMPKSKGTKTSTVIQEQAPVTTLNHLECNCLQTDTEKGSFTIIDSREEEGQCPGSLRFAES